MLRVGSLTSVNIRGPFGTPIGPAEGSVAAANVVVVGSGTGIVPMLSLLKSRIRKLRQLSVEELNRHYKTLVDQETDGNLA
jgi:NAD(P)H-flavin reductase